MVSVLEYKIGISTFLLKCITQELDTDGNDENQTLFETDDGSDAEQLGNTIMETILSAFPGIDETITYAKTMK